MVTQAPETQRENLQRWLAAHDLKPFAAAKKAGIAPATLYNFLGGRSRSLSSSVLSSLAAVTGDTVDSILTGSTAGGDDVILVTHLIGSQGSMFLQPTSERITLARPAGVPLSADISAAIIDGNGLAPIPDGWAVFFEMATTRPEDLVGALAVVRFSGGGERPVVRKIVQSQIHGMFSLESLAGDVLPDVEILAAHRVVSFASVD